MARLSVIVPTFNRVGYLEETIASISSQDYRDVDVIVADNASTDATATLMAGAEDPRLHHVRRTRNIGWRANFNRALHDVESEYVALVSDDDRLLPGALTRAVSLLDEAPGVGLVHATFHIIGDRGETIRTDGNWTGDIAEDRVERGSDFIVSSMQTGCQVCLSSVVMRNAALPEVCFEAADDEQGDFMLFLRIALDWDIGFLATPGVELRVHEGQLSNAFDRADLLEASMATKLRFVAAHSARLDHAAVLRRAARGSYAASALSLVSLAARDSRAECIRALRRAVRRWPRLLLAPGVWRVAVKVLVGPRVLGSLRGLRTRR